MLNPLHSEVECLYNQTFSQGINVLTICASKSGEGTSSLCALLAQRCLLTGQKTLLVDLNVYNPSLNPLLAFELTADNGQLSEQSNETTLQITTEQAVLAAPQLIETGKHALVGITAPKRKDAILKLRTPEVIAHYIQQWRRDFDCIIIDTTPLSRRNLNNIPAEIIAKASDAAILIVKAGVTTIEMVDQSIETLKQQEVNLMGTVINDVENPLLKHELLRKLRQSKYLPTWLINRLAQSICNSKLLNLAI